MALLPEKDVVVVEGVEKRGTLARGWRRGNSQAFTIVELMVAMVILVILMAVVASMTDHLGRAWRASSSKMEAFQAARHAFETMTQRMRQATLNTYWDYDNPNDPTQYVRKSELHFITGQAATGASALIGSNSSINPTHAAFFLAPLGYTEDRTSFDGLDNLLTASGYYIEFGKDASPPGFLAPLDPQYRYRLKQFLQASEKNSIYSSYTASDPSSFNKWFVVPLSSNGGLAPLANLADNIIALVMLPMLPPQEDDGTALAPDYLYDSRRHVTFTTTPPNGLDAQTGSTLHQLPPLMRVAVVAIDEPFAARLNPPGQTTPPNLVSTTLFQKASLLDEDLATLTGQLNAKPQVNCRVFDTAIALRNAKWSY